MKKRKLEATDYYYVSYDYGAETNDPVLYHLKGVEYGKDKVKLESSPPRLYFGSVINRAILHLSPQAALNSYRAELKAKMLEAKKNWVDWTQKLQALPRNADGLTKGNE